MPVTPLFNYTPQNASIIAGMLVAFSTDATDPDTADPAGTWTPWNGITEIGDIGNTGAFIEQTTLADTTKRYMAGMKDTSEQEVTIQFRATENTNSKQRKTA